ncbi:unnamed protein product [Urochloa humidicola]
MVLVRGPKNAGEAVELLGPASKSHTRLGGRRNSLGFKVQVAGTSLVNPCHFALIITVLLLELCTALDVRISGEARAD